MKPPFEITDIRIIAGMGPDKVFIYTDKTEGTWPYADSLVMKFDVAAGRGIDYVEREFPGFSYQYLDVNEEI